jgi:hypothetical protein
MRGVAVCCELRNHALRICASYALVGIVLCSCEDQSQSTVNVSDVAQVIDPVFRTPVSGISARRPAIKLEILDDSEWVWGTAELYLFIQSSRCPEDTSVLIPLNIGESAGCLDRFIQLPFEVQPEDVLLFTILDDDGLSRNDVEAITTGCEALGYVVLVGTVVYVPAMRLVAPGAAKLGTCLGHVVVEHYEQRKMSYMGNAEYIVPRGMPVNPQDANKLALINKKNNHVRAVLKIFGPSDFIVYRTSGT